MAHRLPALTITFDGQPTPTATSGYGDANAVVLTTAIPALALTLTSVSLGAGAGQALSAHLAQAYGREPALAVERVDALELPVSHARRRCLLEHAAALYRDASASTTAAVTVDVSDAALAAADALFDPHA